MKVDGAYKSLLQGVSQQPPRARLDGQCSVQDNLIANPVDGLGIRPPLQYIGELFSTTSSVQYYSIDGSDPHIACAMSGDLKVFSTDAVEKTVTEVSSAFDYLDGSKLSFTTMDNDTIIANESTTVQMETELPNFLDYGVIIYIRGGQYGTTYTISVRWNSTAGVAQDITVSYRTSNTDRSTIETAHIAEELETLLDAETGDSFNTTFNVYRVEDVLYITWDDSRTDTFTATIGDTAGNSNAIAVNNAVKQVSELPRFAPHGYYVVVTGDGSQTVDDYYLEYSVTPDDDGDVPAIGQGFGKPGRWVETVKKDIEYLLNWDTMPHVLEYVPSTDTFIFSAGQWDDRIVGDEDSNPTPSFVGSTISDVSYFQGRLVTLSGPNVVMSRTNEPYNFWAESGTIVSDSDPIDIQSTASGVTNMQYAIPHNRDLVIFAEDTAQFIVFGRNKLTPGNSSLVLTTSFESNLKAKPVTAGRNVFFAIDYGNYGGVREFYTESSADINDSVPITEHVLKYIEGSITYLASSSNFDTLLVKASDPNVVYVYEYIWNADTKVQTAWSRWLFNDEVEYLFFDESVIYFIMKNGNNRYLTSMDLDSQNDVDVGYQVKLDNKVEITGVNTSITTTVPYTDYADSVYIQGEGCPNPGLRVVIQSRNESTGELTLTKSMNGGTVIAGTPYTYRYRPTMPMVKDKDGIKIGSGRLTIKSFKVSTNNSGGFEAKHISKYRPDQVFKYTPRVVGEPSTTVGNAAITSSVYVIPFRDNAEYGEIEIFGTSHTPFNILDIEYIGQYTKRGKRI